jgi:hypothetical protein
MGTILYVPFLFLLTRIFLMGTLLMNPLVISKEVLQIVVPQRQCSIGH